MKLRQRALQITKEFTCEVLRGDLDQMRRLCFDDLTFDKMGS